MRLRDRTGDKVHRLLVLERVPNSTTRVRWKCLCDCGRVTVVSALNLLKTKSCGCLRRDEGRKTGLRNRTHGEAVALTGEYKSWQAMRYRCEHQTKYYEGVTVCERWSNSFENFLSDMGRQPTPAHSIDRFPNNEGNYEPGNCRWATPSQQQQNRRDRAVCQT